VAQTTPPPVPEGYVGRAEGKAPGAPKLKVTEFSKSGRRFELVMSKGDEIVSGIAEFAEKNHVTTAHFSAIGAIDKGTLGWFDPDKRAYKKIEVNSEVEILTLTGNIATGPNGKPNVHAHIIVGMPDGQARGGHLVEGYISLTLQCFVDEEEPLAAPATQKQ
jgi:predicted DNA-binding protein with PD1-like motif